MGKKKSKDWRILHEAGQWIEERMIAKEPLWFDEFVTSMVAKGFDCGEVMDLKERMYIDFIIRKREELRKEGK